MAEDSLPDAYLNGVLAGDYEYVQRSLVENPRQASQSFTDRDTTLLHCASLDGEIGAVRQLINLGANVNSKEQDGTTPMHAAAQNGNCDVLDCLIQHGGSINAVTCDGVSVLLSAATARVASKEAAVSLLLSHGCNVDLQSAVRLASHDDVRRNLQAMPRGTFPYDFYMDLLSIAIRNRDVASVKMLLAHMVTIGDAAIDNLLHIARGDLDQPSSVVDLLLATRDKASAATDYPKQ